ncbi:MAG: hypothetical protein JWP27_2189 [Flaviaesturariibacter sp.]|nr:hypothetical protein [Flaviaesturariibacter sp.]
MHFIKLALLSFLFLFLVVTGISLFIPSHIRISKATNLAVPADSAWRLIRDTAHWKEWHPWFMQSPGLVSQIGVNWTAQNDSVSSVEMSQATKKTLLNTWQVHRYASTDSITLQWYMDFHPRWYPWEKFGSLFYESSYGTVMEAGLANLRNRLSR